jgi:hypothetical protein
VTSKKDSRHRLIGEFCVNEMKIKGHEGIFIVVAPLICAALVRWRQAILYGKSTPFGSSPMFGKKKWQLFSLLPQVVAKNS